MAVGSVLEGAGGLVDDRACRLHPNCLYRRHLHIGNGLKVGRDGPDRRRYLLIWDCMAEISALNDLIAPIVTDLGFDLVRVQMNGSKSAQTLQVMAEDRATGQLTLDQCATISRALSEMLDATDPIEHEYRLEVSSPGIDRPLTRAADYAKWIGHEVRLKLVPGEGGAKRMHGVIGALVGDGVTIVVPTTGAAIVPLASIEGAKLVLTNKLIAATRPLDSDGADEIIELPAANDINEEDD